MTADADTIRSTAFTRISSGTATLAGSGRIHQYSAACPDGAGALNNWCGHDRYPTSGDFFFDTPAIENGWQGKPASSTSCESRQVCSGASG